MQDDFYQHVKKSSANSSDIVVSEDVRPSFPSDGIYIGELCCGGLSFPALIDIEGKPFICFLYNSDETRKQVNGCLERLVWRLVASLPPELISLSLYGGSLPGEFFNTQSRIDDVLFSSPQNKVFFEDTRDKFEGHIDSILKSIQDRMSEITCHGVNNIVELNAKLGERASLKYEFIFLADFPEGLSRNTVHKISKIVRSGAKAGIYVFMGWDMATDIDDDLKVDLEAFFETMELIFPFENRYLFKNSGHDDILNSFNLTLNSQPISPTEVQEWASGISRLVSKMKQMQNGIIKYDYKPAITAAYQTNPPEISVVVGSDVYSGIASYLKFNSSDYTHAFILGQSGSGKSVLLNNIIISLILQYSPEDLMLYLMDFKGVEFNRFKGEKHTRVVLVDNRDLYLTLEVLRELMEENKKRISLWQEEGVRNIDGYNSKHPEARMPIILFVADECQVMFQMPQSVGVQWEIHREICNILNAIATQGRSQGIHMLLATQQLGGTDISGQVLKNLTECFLLMSAPSDSNILVPDSSAKTEKQPTGEACYYHKKEFITKIKSYFLTDEELDKVIRDAKMKAKDKHSNGGLYFCGSSVCNISENELKKITSSSNRALEALVGKMVSLKNDVLRICLQRDYSENILFIGESRQGQAASVLINALITLISSYKAKNVSCDFIVIDCLSDVECEYQHILAHMESLGLCQLIQRQDSTHTIYEIANNISNNTIKPVVLAIIGSERYVEMKRNGRMEASTTIPAPTTIVPLNLMDSCSGRKDISSMTFQETLTYILDEGPMNGVNTLLQVNKPGNILFEGDYGTNATDKFRHKVLLRSENKALTPLHLEKAIDTENLGVEKENLRAFYCHEGEDPVLFTPYQLPTAEIINFLKQ